MDNLFNTGTRASVDVVFDTAIKANRTEQLEQINMGGYGIKTVSVDGYINSVNRYNNALANFIYRLAKAAFENSSFTEDDISDIILFRSGSYDSEGSLIDTVLVMGYKKTGFERIDVNN